MPATSWKRTILAQLARGSRSMKRPNPSVITAMPKMMLGRYLPVFLMTMPVPADTSERDMTQGRTYTPDISGDAPRTAWK